MATIARFLAVVAVGPLRVTGLAAWLRWLVVHLAFLTGFKNRLAVVANRAVAFLGQGRRQRTSTEQQVFARTRQVSERRQVDGLMPGKGGVECRSILRSAVTRLTSCDGLQPCTRGPNHDDGDIARDIARQRVSPILGRQVADPHLEGMPWETWPRTCSTPQPSKAAAPRCGWVTRL